jgi:hypothetical protein
MALMSYWCVDADIMWARAQRFATQLAVWKLAVGGWSAEGLSPGIDTCTKRYTHKASGCDSAGKLKRLALVAAPGVSGLLAA